MAASAIFAVIFAVHQRAGRHHLLPQEQPAFGLVVGRGVLVFQVVCRVALDGVSDEAKVPFFILLQAHRHDT